MAKITTHKRTDEEDDLIDGYEVEEDGIAEEYEDAEEEVMSDLRARQKRKRGELVEGATTEKKNRPTPSRRGGVAGSETSAFQNFIEKIPVVRTIYRIFFLGLYNYFKAAISEMRKVKWPTREETMRLTRLVLIVTVIFSIVLGALDVFYGWWFKQAALDNDTLFLIVAAGVAAIGMVLTWFIFIRSDEYSPF